MRNTMLVFLMTALATSTDLTAQSQSAKPAERGAYLTMFRSPATGIELRSGHAAMHVGFYPTILRKDGKQDNANFIRAGASWFLKDRGASVYVSPSLVWSLGSQWKSGALMEIGFRGPIRGNLNGRIGGAVLTTLDGQVRVNPTVGMDIRLGAGR
jgi:hypothetical protein